MTTSALKASVAIATLLAASTAAVAAGPKAIAWGDDLDEARDAAKGSARLVWVQFTGPWCHNCERMERETFVSERVVDQASTGFVPVKLRSDRYEAVALRYGLSALPATVILGPTGEAVATVQGFQGPDQLLAFLASARTRAGLPPAPRPAPEAKPVGPAVGGVCLVSLVDDHKLLKGDAKFRAEHQGAVYRFATAAKRSAFRKDPGRYAPVNGGRCPVAQVDRGVAVGGEAKWGVLFGGHLYLCGGDADRKTFLKQPERYANVDAADRGFCPHCLAADGLLVRGRPEVSLARDGKRYLFPDPSHLDAFRDRSQGIRR